MVSEGGASRCVRLQLAGEPRGLAGQCQALVKVLTLHSAQVSSWSHYRVLSSWSLQILLRARVQEKQWEEYLGEVRKPGFQC